MFFALVALDQIIQFVKFYRGRMEHREKSCRDALEPEIVPLTLRH